MTRADALLILHDSRKLSPVLHQIWIGKYRHDPVSIARRIVAMRRARNKAVNICGTITAFGAVVILIGLTIREPWLLFLGAIAGGIGVLAWLKARDIFATDPTQFSPPIPVNACRFEYYYHVLLGWYDDKATEFAALSYDALCEFAEATLVTTAGQPGPTRDLRQFEHVFAACAAFGLNKYPREHYLH
jgi:hypothetical protein